MMSARFGRERRLREERSGLMEDRFDLLDGWPGTYTPPSPRVLPLLRDRAERTPDLGKLRLFEHILLFVYCDMKRSGNNSHFLKDTLYLGEAKTTTNGYMMKNSSYPIVLNNTKKSGPPQGFIRGEMYAVPVETIIQIDKVKGNGKMFSRVQRHFTLNDQSFKTKQGKQSPVVPAYIYMGKEEFWSSANIHLCTIFSSGKDRTKKYYEYIPPRNMYPH